MAVAKTTPVSVHGRVRDGLTGRKLTWLLVTLMLAFLGLAFGGSHGLLWLKGLVALILGAGLYAVRGSRWRVGLLFAVPALTASAVNLLTHLHSRPLMVVEGAFSIRSPTTAT